MLAKNPEEICRLFRQYMAKGDLEPLLSLYDDQVVFLNAAGDAKRGRQEVREELAPFAAAGAHFDFNIRQIIESDGIALMHTDWEISSPQRMSVYAIEVARRQTDGTWGWLIGDPFTVGRRTTHETVNSGKQTR